MKTISHNIRRRVVNEYGQSVVKIEEVIGELSSEFFDKNGVEIFEGDIVKVTHEDGGIEPETVKFKYGEFLLEGFGERLRSAIEDGNEVEVIGHIMRWD